MRIGEKPARTAALDRAPAVATGVVVVTGRAQVRLKGAAGVVPIGDVPVGTYKVEAAFSDSVFRDFGTLTVKVGARHTVQCDPRFRKCVIR